MANSVFNLSNLNGINGFAINIDRFDSSGIVSNAGDINGDGFDDLIIGARNADPNGAYSGQTYVVFGSQKSFGAQFNLSTLNGTNGFAINGNYYTQLSYSLSSAGDINGDGLDDLIINAAGNRQNYVVFGSKGDFDASIDASTLNGASGFAINKFDNTIITVSSAGDINGDGLDDLLFGAPTFGSNPFKSASGRGYVVFGSKKSFGAQFNVSTLNGTNGFVIKAINPGDILGTSVSSAGDINGDGIDDLIIGAPGADPNGSYSGQSYVVFGSKSGFSAQFNLSTLNGINGFAINGINPSDASGISVSSAGDINGDGLDDLIINGRDFNSSKQSYVVFGSKESFGAQFNLSTLNGTNGFAINVINANEGSSVSSAGDFNGDGLDDLIIGAPLASPNGTKSGQSYVVFGSKESFGAQFNLSTLNGTNGFAINGINPDDHSGFSVSSVGDFNGDGLDDLIIAAGGLWGDGFISEHVSGQSYVVFGNRAPVLDLNGNSQGIDFSTTFSGTPVSIIDHDFTLSDNKTTLAGATITITNLLKDATETLNATTVGNITATYNPTTGTLTLSGTDTIANYRQVLNSLTYNSTATTINTTIEFVVDDGEAPLNTSVVATTTLGSIQKFITGTKSADILTGTRNNNIIEGKAGNDKLTGNGGRDKFIFLRGDGIDIITDFGGIGKDSKPSAGVISQVDTLDFTDSGLTAKNLQLTQNGNNLEVTFEDVANTKVILQNFKLENLDDLPASDTRPAIGNILFDQKISITDSFDVFDANSTQTNLFNKNTVTFLNDLNNNITSFDNSNDVINGQGGDDIIDGKDGNDLLRGGTGNDTLIGNFGDDTLVGGAGADRFLFNTIPTFYSPDIDTISDFNSSEGDKIVLDKTIFSAIASTPGTGFSNKSDFQVTNLGQASTARIVYNPVTGQLFYNQNGSAEGFGNGGQFATLVGAPNLSISDFIIQA
ncbi:hypothetical protein [Nostoc sp.]|uniref:hypothetical protein n=1 Tax=Nostoc sp. TaxID=1180 RepID=UPI002FF4FA04